LANNSFVLKQEESTDLAIFEIIGDDAEWGPPRRKVYETNGAAFESGGCRRRFGVPRELDQRFDIRKQADGDT